MSKEHAGRVGVAPALDDDLEDLRCGRCGRCGLAVVDESECPDPDCPYHPGPELEEVLPAGVATATPSLCRELERTYAADGAPHDAEVQGDAVVDEPPDDAQALTPWYRATRRVAVED